MSYLSNTNLLVRLPSGHGTRWYEAGGWDEITDLRTTALLERCPSPVLS